MAVDTSHKGETVMFNLFGRNRGCGQGCGCSSGCGNCNNGCGCSGGCDCCRDMADCEVIGDCPCCPVCPPVVTVPDVAPYTVVFNGGSGNAAALTATSGASTNFAIVGTGNTALKYAPFSSTVTLSPAEQASAFVLPATGTLYYFNASFILSATPTATNATVYAALMTAPKGSSTYSLVPGSTITLASGLTSATPSGSVYSGSAKLCLPVTDERIAVVCFVTDNTSATVTGYLSGTLSVR